jgi:GrpB-like predicted nucleotidyltransferase (UPF0157 family)
MVEGSFTEHWDRLLFRDYLIDHPQVATEYETLKLRLSEASPNDRVTYTTGKTKFVMEITKRAKQAYWGNGRA